MIKTARKITLGPTEGMNGHMAQEQFKPNGGTKVKSNRTAKL